MYLFLSRKRFANNLLPPAHAHTAHDAASLTSFSLLRRHQPTKHPPLPHLKPPRPPPLPLTGRLWTTALRLSCQVLHQQTSRHQGKRWTLLLTAFSIVRWNRGGGDWRCLKIFALAATRTNLPPFSLTPSSLSSFYFLFFIFYFSIFLRNNYDLAF